MQLVLKHRQRLLTLVIDVDEPLRVLAQRIVDALGQELDASALTLVSSSVRGCKPQQQPNVSIQAAGFTDGQTVMVIASPKADVQRAKASRDDSRMLSIAEELARSARRAQRAVGAVGPPAGEFTFGDYRALPIAAIPGASPGKDKALQLLHRLAADAGIVGIMRQNKFKVGLLSEMPPTDHMDETRAVTCLLGLNINAGQEIKLRLRTNDLLGFRNYQRIRETLVHELTHNVHQDHGTGFKTLNSQLLRECVRINGAMRSAQSVLGSAAEVREPSGDAAFGSEAEPAPRSNRLGGAGSAAAPPGQVAAWAAEARRQAAAAHAAAAQSAGDITTAFERPADEDTALEEAALAALGDDAGAAGPASPRADGGQVAASPNMSGRLLAGAPSDAGQHAEERTTPHSSVSTAALAQQAAPAPTAQKGANRGADAMDVEQATAPACDSATMSSEVPSEGALQAGLRDPEPLSVNAPRAHGIDGAVAGSNDGEDDAALFGVVDAMAARLHEVRAVLQSIAALQRPEEAERARAALGTIQQIMGNALREPGNDKFRRVRRANKTFAARVVPCPQVEALMKLAGFALVDGTWSLGRRDDPAMLWLVHSMLQNAPQAAQG